MTVLRHRVLNSQGQPVAGRVAAVMPHTNGGKPGVYSRVKTVSALSGTDGWLSWELPAVRSQGAPSYVVVGIETNPVLVSVPTTVSTATVAETRIGTLPTLPGETSIDLVTEAELSARLAGLTRDVAADPELRAAFDAWGGGVGGGDFALREETPTLEELERTSRLGTIAATGTVRLGPTSFNQRIGALTLATAANVAASDTNYWTVALLRLRAGAATATITTRSTKATGGEAFTADKGWNFDAVPWTDASRHLLKGDVLALSFTKTGTPADLTDVTAAVRYEPGVTFDGPPPVEPVLRDTFTRADSVSSLGTADTGQAWEAPLAGTFGISGGKAYASALTSGYAYVLADSGLSDYTLSVVVSTAGTSQGLVFRATDYNNLIDAGTSGVFKTAGGTTTGIIGAPPGGVVAGDVLKVTVSGSTISYYKNDVLVGTVTDAFNETATRVGIFTSDTTVRLDNLELVP